MFNPYEQWLGIAKDQRPITYYTLLGVSPKETDADVIEAAAQKRLARIRTHAEGPHAAIGARIEKELEQARGTLLNPVRRKQYDARLRELAVKATRPVEADAVEVADVEAVEDMGAAEAGEPEVKRAKSLAGRKGADGKLKRRPNEEAKGKPILLFVALGAVGLLVLAAGLGTAAYLVFRDKEPAKVASATPTTGQVAVQAINPNPPKTSDPTASKPADQIAPKPTEPVPPKPVVNPAPPPPVKAPEVKPAAPKVVKLPIPEESVVAKAEQALKDANKAEYAKAKPEDRAALAAKFLVPDREDRKDPAAWFALLRQARDLAIEGKRARLAIEAINEMDRWFVIDPVEMKIQAIKSTSKGGSEFQVASVVRATFNLIQQAYYDENFDAAKRYLDTIEAAVREVNAPQVLKLVRDQQVEMEAYAKDRDAVVQAKTKLAGSPDDPEANFTVGRYLCFFLEDWDRGLPMLAKGSNDGLKELARKDLAKPAEVKDQLAVAHGWWNWGINQADRMQRNLIKHSRLWYERAGPNTQGADRAAVIDRITDSYRKEHARVQRLLPGSFYGRDPENRTILLREGGGNLKSEEAVEMGLEWLAKHQSSSGAWTTDLFHKAGQCKCTEPGEKHDVAGTAFGLLPFLGAGETHRKGKHSGLVNKGLGYLLRQQKPKGNFSDNAYENALASIAVIELFGMSRDAQLRLSAQAAANYIAAAQFSDGSWGYSAGTKGDTSVCGWQFTALKAAAYAGLAVSPESFDRLSKFLDTVAEPGGLGYGYNTPGAGPSTSAVGLLCREFLTWGPGHPGLTKGVETLLGDANVPTKDKISIYSVFYINQVAHHLGGAPWEKWNYKVRDLLIELQDKGEDPKLAHQKGSWSPRNDPFAKQGGRLMFTSLALITLEGYYYHIPLYGAGPYTLLD